jgi:hypothetical protein
MVQEDFPSDIPVVVDDREARSHLGLSRAKGGRFREVHIVESVDTLIFAGVLECCHHLKIFEPAVFVATECQDDLLNRQRSLLQKRFGTHSWKIIVQALFELLVRRKMMNSTHMLWDGKDHLSQKLSIAVAVLEAMPQHISDAPDPDAQGLASLQLTRLEQILGHRLDPVPHIVGVDDLWQTRVSSDLVDVSHQGFNLGAAVSCTHSKFDALLV